MPPAQRVLRIPSLYGGISRQPPDVRFSNQVADAQNVRFDVFNGASKRPPTFWIADPAGLDATDDYRLHAIIRDQNEQYVVVYGAGVLKVFESDGTPCTVNITSNAQSYLDANAPNSNQIRLASLVDATFIVNTTVTAAQSGGTPTATTLPVKMARTSAAVGEVAAVFDVDVIPWVNRASGTDSTNPPANVIGSPIADIAYFQGRLVLVGDENITFSRANDLFDLWIEDVANITDADPINLSLSTDQVTFIDFVVPFRNTLTLFTKAGRQFDISVTSGALTPTTPAITASTQYDSLPIRPQTSGPFVYFGAKQGQRSDLMEYFYDDVQASSQASNVSAHVRGLLPREFRSIAAHPGTGTVFVLPVDKTGGVLGGNDFGLGLIQENGLPLLTEAGQDIQIDASQQGNRQIGVYRSHWVGREKAQSAWSRYLVDEAEVIHDIAVVESDLMILSHDDTGRFTLQRLPIAEPQALGNMPFAVVLDRVQTALGTHAAGVTTWTLESSDDRINAIVLGGDFADAGQVIVPASASGTTVTASGNYAAGDCYLGRRYTMRVDLTRPYVRNQLGEADVHSLTTLRQMSVSHHLTGDYTLSASATNRATRNVSFAAPAKTVSASGSTRANFSGNVEALSLSIASETPRPATITAVEYRVNYDRREA